MLPEPPIWLIVLAFICALGPLVFFHELGHYLVARLFGIAAESFSIGFGHELIGWTDRQGTRWKVAWLPLGGYVKFVGDMSPASNPADASDVAPELHDRAFQFRPVWQRFLVVLAGPAANFLLAILIFAAFFTLVGTPRSNFVGRLMQASPAAEAGIRPGDRILSINGIPTPTFGDLQTVVMVRPGETVTVGVRRGSTQMRLQVHLGVTTVQDPTGGRFKAGVLGVYSTTQAGETVSPLRALPMAAAYTARLVRSMADGLVQTVRGAVSPKQLGGPIKMAQIVGEGAAEGVLAFVSLVALLSINLGFINLLPVPLLDGGHLFFYAVEAIRRRPFSSQTVEWAFRGGLAVIVALMIFLTLNDLGSVGLWDRLQRLIG